MNSSRVYRLNTINAEHRDASPDCLRYICLCWGVRSRFLEKSGSVRREFFMTKASAPHASTTMPVRRSTNLCCVKDVSI